MTDIKQIFDQLSATSSRLEKERILLEQQDNELLKKVFVLALSPMITFHIKKIPPHVKNVSQHAASLKAMLPALDDLSSRAVTGLAAINRLTKILQATRADDAFVIERIIEKDVRCGVSEKTVNKIWPGLIPEYPCMLCHPYDEKTEKHIKYPALAQLKLDGMRFNAICSNNQVEFRTRNGKSIDLLGHLENEFIKLADGALCVFDGELLVFDEFEYQYLPRQTSNGILSKALKGTITEAECKRAAATVWDMITLEDFHAGRSSTPYIKRFEALETKVNKLANHKINLVMSKDVQTPEEAQQLFEQLLADGQEGLIVKNKTSPWESKRVRHQAKLKGENECDLEIVGWEEGTGKNKGRLGALVVQSRDGVVQVSVGSGFTDSDRDSIGLDVIGKICAVKYNGRIKDRKTGVESLFLPIFVEVRSDKTQADTSKEIK